MKTIFEDMLKQLPTFTSKTIVKEGEKVLGILGADSLVNLSLEDRMALAENLEYLSGDTYGFLTLKVLVPTYAIKKNSLLFKKRENPYVTTAQCQHAQQLYDSISYSENSYPYGTIKSYDFEPWTEHHLRFYIIIEYDKDLNKTR